MEEKAAKKAAKEETKRQKMELKERKKSRLSESIEEETLIEEDEKEPASVQPTPNYAADLFEPTLPTSMSTVDDANSLPTVIPASPSVKPSGITVKPHFTPLPSSQVPGWTFFLNFSC